MMHELLASAFPTSAEALLVDDLRAAHALPVSLVATDGQRVLGHVGFSPVAIRPEPTSLTIWALAPLDVAPDAQRCGIGSSLVQAGLRACADAECYCVVVVGEPRFYRRFGFIPAAERGLDCSFDVPAEALMIAETRAGAFPFHQGVVHFHKAFDRFATPSEPRPQAP